MREGEKKRQICPFNTQIYPQRAQGLTERRKKNQQCTQNSSQVFKEWKKKYKWHYLCPFFPNQASNMRSMYVLVREFYYHMLIQFQSSLSPAFNAQNAKYKIQMQLKFFLISLKHKCRQNQFTHVWQECFFQHFSHLYCISLSIRDHTFFPQQCVVRNVNLPPCSLQVQHLACC